MECVCLLNTMTDEIQVCFSPFHVCWSKVCVCVCVWLSVFTLRLLLDGLLADSFGPPPKISNSPAQHTHAFTLTHTNNHTHTHTHTHTNTHTHSHSLTLTHICTRTP